MKTYRSFWNKVWESPVLDNTSSDGDGLRKKRWELDVNLKYSVLLTDKHDSNGLMETKMLTAEPVTDTSSEKIEGRMKAGMEISLAELNKLIPLWGNQPALTNEQLAALKVGAVASQNASEILYNLKLKGKAGERGLVWVIPVFKLFNFSLCKIKISNESGEVTEVEDESILFPLPVSAKILGLKSK
jgi:hypothetical protein